MDILKVVFAMFVTCALGLLTGAWLKSNKQPVTEDVVVLCAIEGQPSAGIDKIVAAWPTGESIKTLAKDGTVTQYKMHNGEICYITTTKPR